MKIIEATWERRNLGMGAWEVILTESDCLNVDYLISSLRESKFNGSYVCVKLPVGNLRVLHALEDEGFRFVETQLRIKDCFEASPTLHILEKMSDKFDRRTVPHNRALWDEICNKITPGMFVTDRIALDPEFGPDVACLRYRNWIMDLLDDNNSELEVTSVDGVDVAFSLKKNITGKDSVALLGGVFEEFKEAGYGAVAMLDKWSRDRGERKKTVISSNNIDVFKLHQNCGRIVYGESYVLRKIYQSV